MTNEHDRQSLLPAVDDPAPFEPSAETIAAMEEACRGRLKVYADFASLVRDLDLPE